ncbi:hypothetical protein PR048_024925 [Dryococelus australis]|uniref:Uncharacterized protein n=1 Tax=Dryococelus australis TaxID=614101 RepID=A0ABQ9GPX1_9NEOP|nr:hypothetical protein PR048_024925 [Dryococelus australis]
MSKIIPVMGFSSNTLRTNMRTHLSENNDNGFPQQLLKLGEEKLPFPSAKGGSAEFKLDAGLGRKVHELELLGNISRCKKCIAKRVSFALFKGNSSSQKRHTEQHQSNNINWACRRTASAYSAYPYDPNDLRIPFNRLQFPVKVPFALTIIKSQEQIFKFVGIDLTKECFSHGCRVIWSRDYRKPNFLLPENNKTINISESPLQSTAPRGPAAAIWDAKRLGHPEGPASLRNALHTIEGNVHEVSITSQLSNFLRPKIIGSSLTDGKKICQRDRGLADTHIAERCVEVTSYFLPTVRLPRLIFTVTYPLELTVFLHWQLHSCEATSGLTELLVNGHTVVMRTSIGAELPRSRHMKYVPAKLIAKVHRSLSEEDSDTWDKPRRTTQKKRQCPLDRRRHTVPLTTNEGNCEHKRKRNSLPNARRLNVVLVGSNEKKIVKSRTDIDALATHCTVGRHKDSFSQSTTTRKSYTKKHTSESIRRSPQQPKSLGDQGAVGGNFVPKTYKGLHHMVGQHSKTDQ